MGSIMGAMVPMLPVLFLLLQPPGAAAEAPAESVAQPGGLDAALDELKAETKRIATASEIDREGLETLALAIAAMDDFTVDVSIHEDASKQLIVSRIILARGYTDIDPPQMAKVEAIIEDILRTTAPDQLENIQQLIAKYDQDELPKIAKTKVAQIEGEGLAKIAVACHEGCLVFVDGKPATGGVVNELSVDAFLGKHVVTFLSTTSNEAPDRREITLSKADEVVTLEFGAVTPPQPCDCEDPTCEDPTCPDPDPDCPVCPKCETDCESCDTIVPPGKRMLPRWVEFTGMGVGYALATTGAALLSVDGRCTTDFGRATPICPELWGTVKGGAITLGVGVALAVTSTVVLVIDDQRSRGGRERRVQLTPTGVLRF